MTLVAAAVIPLALAIAIFAIGRAGETLNLMSVGGLAIAVGLIIDDAIVVIENIARNRRDQPELPLREVVTLSMSQIGGAMIASTATTVVVFVPLALLTGVSGFFFRSLALTLATSLIVSLALALFFTPVLAKLFMRSEKMDDSATFVHRVLERYEPILRWSLERRPVIYAASLGVLLVTVALLARLPSDFLPTLDEGQFEIDYVLPVGTSLEASDAAAHHMEQVVAADPAVAGVGRWTGLDTNGYSPTPQNAGILRVRLRPETERAPYPVVSDRLRDELAQAVPAAHFDFHQILEDMIDDVSGAPAPLEVTLEGPDQATLVAQASALAVRLSDVKGLADVFSGVVYTDPAIRVFTGSPASRATWMDAILARRFACRASSRRRCGRITRALQSRTGARARRRGKRSAIREVASPSGPVGSRRHRARCSGCTCNDDVRRKWRARHRAHREHCRRESFLCRFRHAQRDLRAAAAGWISRDDRRPISRAARLVPPVRRRRRDRHRACVRGDARDVPFVPAAARDSHRDSARADRRRARALHHVNAVQRLLLHGAVAARGYRCQERHFVDRRGKPAPRRRRQRRGGARRRWTHAFASDRDDDLCGDRRTLAARARNRVGRGDGEAARDRRDRRSLDRNRVYACW